MRGRQDPEHVDRDSELASTRATGAYRYDSEHVVHLSKINSRIMKVDNESGSNAEQELDHDRLHII